jgi:hypothetical protein
MIGGVATTMLLLGEFMVKILMGSRRFGSEWP